MLERSSPVPLYQQLEEVFRARIASGEWPPGERIPSENELNRAFGLSRMTVRGVLNKLTRDGLLFRVAGKGTYVANQKINAVSPAYRGVREQLESMGYSTSTQLRSLDLVDPPHHVRLGLQLEMEEEVFAIVRLRFADDEPISVHRSFVPAALAPGLGAHDVVNEQLCAVLEENYGLPIATVEENLEAIAAGGSDAQLLGLRRGAPALLLTDLIKDGRDVPFEFSTIVFRGDRLRLRFDYRR